MEPDRQKQRGNILFVLLITLGLFAALVFNFGLSSERTVNSRDLETAYIDASDILKYTAQIGRGFERVQLANNCNIDEISFDHPDRANFNTANFYLNPNARPDGSCDVFGASGGGITYETPPAVAIAEGGVEYNIQNNVEVAGFNSSGTNQSDLLIMTFVSEDICLQINNIMGIELSDGEIPIFSSLATMTVPATTAQSFPDFTTNADGFNVPAFEIGGAVITKATVLSGFPAGCFHATNALDKYVFYNLLRTR